MTTSAALHKRPEFSSFIDEVLILHPAVQDEYPQTFAHFARLVEHVHFQPDLKPYVEKLLAKAGN